MHGGRLSFRIYIAVCADPRYDSSFMSYRFISFRTFLVCVSAIIQSVATKVSLTRLGNAVFCSTFKHQTIIHFAFCEALPSVLTFD